MSPLFSLNFKYSEEDLHVLNTLNKFGGDKDKTRAALLEELGDKFYGDTYVDELGNTVRGFAVESVLNGIYHGTGADYTERILEIAKNDMINVGSVIGGETVEEGDERIGCVIVTEELANILQLLMDKYTFAGVDNSWTKLCYYHEYFGPEAQ